MEINSKIGEALKTAVSIISLKDVDVFVTGTTGLCLLDFAPEGYVPNDIDLKIEKRQMTYELREWLKEQEEMHGVKHNPDYKDESYTLIVKGVTVNVIVSEKSVNHLHLVSNFIDGMKLNIEHPFDTLKAKDMLNRRKDKDFILSLINRLTSLYQ